MNWQASLTAMLLAASASLADPLIGNPHRLINEHVDLNVIFTPTTSSWNLQPRDGDFHNSYPSNQALMHVDQFAANQFPGSVPAEYAFTGASPGQDFYVLPQGQNPQLLYLGFAGYGVQPGTFDVYDPTTESGGRAGGMAEWMRLSLAGVKGPGEVAVWENDSFGAPRVMISTVESPATGNNIWLLTQGHSHFNFSFTQRGLYRLDLRPSGYIDGQLVQSATTLPVYFNVSPGYATSRATVESPTQPQLGSVTLTAQDAPPQVVATSAATKGSVALNNLSTGRSLWVLLDLSDETEAGAVKVALSGFDPDGNGYQPGLNDYDLLDVQATALTVLSGELYNPNDVRSQGVALLNGHAGFDVAFYLHQQMPAGLSHFEFDYSMILDGAGVDRVGFVAVPEPASLSLLSLGAVALLRRRRRRMIE